MATNEITLREIRAILQKEEMKKLIRETMPVVNEARVTTGKAGTLLSLSPTKLREWDKAGLVKPERDSDSPTTSQRQYSLADLKKLVILKILDKELKNIGMDVSDIATDVDGLLQEAEIALNESVRDSQGSLKDGGDGRHINQRIQDARKELSLRYYTSHVFRLSLSLLSEIIRDTPIGLVLPLQQNASWLAIKTIEDLPLLGPSLVGWLSTSKSSHTLLTLEPSFEYVTDYALLPFTTMRDEVVSGDIQGIYLILNRQDKRTRKLSLSEAVVKLITRLLEPIIKERELLREQFGSGMRDMLEPATNLNTHEDLILNGLADMIVQLGGYTTRGEQRWRFCSILLPEESLLPLHKRNLVIRAQSVHAPSDYRIGTTTITSTEHSMSLSLQAFRSGHVQYRNVYESKEPVVAYSDIEVKEDIRSAIAAPVGGEDGLPLGVFYVASNEMNRFSQDDQRVLRFMSRVIEEILRTYTVRKLVLKGLESIIQYPDVVDELFRNFPSQYEFAHDLEQELQEIYVLNDLVAEDISLQDQENDTQDTHNDQVSTLSQAQDVLSFIAIDVDDLRSLSEKYGDVLARNLCYEVGRRIQGELDAAEKKLKESLLYHIYADHFYILFKAVPYEQVIARAKRLKKVLDGSYKVSALDAMSTPLLSAKNMVDVNITVRLAISSYSLRTLKGILNQYPDDVAIPNACLRLESTLEERLRMGMSLDENVIIAWNPKTRRPEPLSLNE